MCQNKLGSALSLASGEALRRRDFIMASGATVAWSLAARAQTPVGSAFSRPPVRKGVATSFSTLSVKRCKNMAGMRGRTFCSNIVLPRETWTR